MTIATGSKLGPYEILGQIGAGGMGEVYRAKDPRLGREVAIKVLPASFSADADRLRRFEQEAKAAGVLNHPNITAVHDIGSHEGAPYVVQELLEGETLRAELAGGRFSPRKAIDYALQIANGLGAAHDKGIVHRDLKPENLFVTKEGRVKILDFGLAKLTQAETGSGPQTNMPTATAGTEPGVVMGTLGYMSPEQIKGKPADARSDMFSFGAILYEMLSGNRAFQADSAGETMAAILKEDPPDLSVTNQNISPGLERVVRHCIEKNPERRFQSAHDLAFDLEALSGTSTERGVAVAEAATKRRAPRLALGAAVALVILALTYGAGVRLGNRTKAGPPVQTYFTQLTSDPGIESYPSLSPDGKLLAYVSRAAGNDDIYVLRVGGKNPINLTRDDSGDDTEPAFSPDGTQIAFRSERQGGGIFLIGATGESVRRLTDVGFTPAWSPDGKEIFFVTESVRNPLDRVFMSELWSVEVSSGKKSRLYAGDAVQPSVSPHGLRIAFWGLPSYGSRRDIYTIPRQGLKEGEKPLAVTNDEAADWNPVWSPDGRFLYFGSNRGGTLNLWRLPIDEASGKPLGQPESLTTPSLWSGFFSVSGDGARIAYVALNPLTSVERAAFDPVTGKLLGTPTTILRGSVIITDPDISPDGQWIALRTSGAQDDLLIVKPDGSAILQLTSDAYRDRVPMWSPDGKRIAFHSDRSGRYEAWTIHPDGSGLTQLTHSEGHEVLAPRWSPDGTKIAWQDGVQAGIIDLAKAGGQANETLPRISDGLAFFPRHWTHDGRGIYGVARAGGINAGVWLYSIDTRRYERLTERGGNPAPLSDGQRFLYNADQLGQVFLYDRRSRKSSPVTSFATASHHSISRNILALSPDNRWLCIVRDVSEADVWMATLKSAASDGPSK